MWGWKQLLWIFYKNSRKRSHIRPTALQNAYSVMYVLLGIFQCLTDNFRKMLISLFTFLPSCVYDYLYFTTKIFHITNNFTFISNNDFKNAHCVKSVRVCSFSVPYFPAFRLNTERYGVFLRIQSEFGKIRTTETPNTDTFHVVALETLSSICHGAFLLK